ncbi:MAG: PQQ-dependent sugar dehydrogenase, partial [Actinomycetota bacterium]|nr:PQQ-dependent sugar dehydrogenase [Actinomycetota bacterium]
LLVALAGLVAALAALGAFFARASAEPEQARLRVQLVASGFPAPVDVVATRSQRDRLYVVGKGGLVHALAGGRRLSPVFLDIRRLVSNGYEQGLLSLAFHPNYGRNRLVYVYYTDRNGDSRVVRYRTDGRRVLQRTRRQLLFIDQPYPNHNGGELAFGPDGGLYLSMGDGGSAGDPENRAQSLRTKLGKFLRINLRRGGAQIAGYGLRNPWRFSFDRRTGDLYIGDVGQNRWEEINFVPRRSPGLENYGWDVYEGRQIYERKRPTARGRLVAPVAVYPLAGGNCAVTGGYVYRGSAVPAARGRYFYGDNCSGRVWSLRVVRGKARDVRLEPFRVDGLSSFGEDVRGELYVASLEGSIYRLSD